MTRSGRVIKKGRGRASAGTRRGQSRPQPEEREQRASLVAAPRSGACPTRAPTSGSRRQREAGKWPIPGPDGVPATGRSAAPGTRSASPPAGSSGSSTRTVSARNRRPSSRAAATASSRVAEPRRRPSLVAQHRRAVLAEPPGPPARRPRRLQDRGAPGAVRLGDRLVKAAARPRSRAWLSSSRPGIAPGGAGVPTAAKSAADALSSPRRPPRPPGTVMRLLLGTLALLSAAACAAPAPGPPPGPPPRPGRGGSAGPPDLRSAAPEEAPSHRRGDHPPLPRLRLRAGQAGVGRLRAAAGARLPAAAEAVRLARADAGGLRWAGTMFSSPGRRLAAASRPLPHGEAGAGPADRSGTA
jgi:hypothetical protein